MMNKQLLFLSLAAAVLFAGCSKNESDPQVIDPTAPAIQISAKSSTRGSIDTKAPVTGTSLDGHTADVYALDGKISGKGTATGALSTCYGSGTMTFDDSKYVGFDEGSLSGLNGGQSLLPQNPTAPLYLYGFYPQGWTIDTPGAIESLSKVFDGSTDLMSSYLSDADDVQIEYGKPNDKGELVFKHLLTRYNIQVKADDAEALTAWGSVKSVVIKDAATANNAVSFNSNGISYKHIGATSAPVFFKLSGTTAVPTYSDDKFEAADFATSQALTTIFTNGCYSMLAPVDVDVDKTTPEITLEVVTLDKVGGVDKKTEVKVSLDQSKFGSAPFSTRGYSVTITLNFRAGAIQAIASVERWKDYGIEYDDVELPKPPVNPPAASDIVTIDGLQWTKGNLVAKNTNECQVGAPGDNGVYFQFGSLVGWTGGTGPGTGQGSPALDKAVWPSAMGASKPSYAWPSKDVAGTSTLADYYFNYSAGSWATQGQNIREFAVAIDGDSGSGTLADGRYAALGVGDPCTYYLGAPWRLPTTTELASITGKTGSSSIVWTTSGVTGRWAASGDSFDGVSGPGAWFGSPLSAGSGTPKVSVNPFFPASGSRLSGGGSLNSGGSFGYYWSSAVNSAMLGSNVYIDATKVAPQSFSFRAYGFPVRCVSPAPTVGDYYYADGSYATELTAGKTATGMIYYVDPADPKKYKVMSLEEAPTTLTWAAAYSYVVAGAQSDADGKANSAAVRAYFTANSGTVGADYSVAFPAFNYCYNYKGKSGSDAVGTWYLPAKSELQYLWCAYNGKDPVAGSSPADAAKQTEWNDRITAAGIAAGITSSNFWSSTEVSGSASYAWVVDFSGGSAYSHYGKSITYYVRCVREF